MKYILVSGGVISGVGKGIIASSFGTILKSRGLRVTSIKIDPYINIDAGTFSPYEHGEVFVLDDGSEVDLDLGNYERFLDVTLHKDNNITTGKIYMHVINKERRGDYLGKTVQVVPHITDAIQEWVERVAKIPVTNDGCEPDVCIIELGGTVGDIEGMPFIEAFRQFQRAKKDNFFLAHVSLVLEPKATGDQKTKPTQASVRELHGLGLWPDMIVCRSEHPISDTVKEKISNFCDVELEQVISIHDLSSIYSVPVLLEKQGLIRLLSKKLKLPVEIHNGGTLDLVPNNCMLSKWEQLAERAETCRKTINIAIVGKYTKLEDSYASLTRAIQHASLQLGYKSDLTFIEAEDLEDWKKQESPAEYHRSWQKLCQSEGVIVPGGFGKRGADGKIQACKWCRTRNIPFLGICLGLQMAVIEFARNVLNKQKADSAENVESDDESIENLIIDMPEHNTGQMGATMRLGKRKTFFVNAHKDDSTLFQLYGKKQLIEERHRHRYEVNPEYVQELENAGLLFTGRDESGKRMEMLELKGHPYYVATQFHPEYLSRPLKPSAPFMGLILAATKQLDSYLANGMRLSPLNEVCEPDVQPCKPLLKLIKPQELEQSDDY